MTRHTKHITCLCLVAIMSLVVPNAFPQDTYGRFVDSLLSVSKTQKPKEKIKTLLLVTDYAIGMDVDLCKACIKEAFRLVHITKDKKMEARIYLWRSIAEHTDGDWGNCIESVQNGLSLIKDFKDANMECELLIIIAQSHLTQGNFPLAMDYFYEVIKLAQKSGNTRVLVKTLNNIGKHYFVKEDYSMAQYLYSISTKLSLRMEDNYDKGEAFLYYAQSLQSMKRIEEALGAVNKSILIYESINDIRGLLRAKNTYGQVMSSINGNLSPLLELEKSARISHLKGFTLGEAFAYSLMGHIYHMQNQPKKMIEAQRKSLDCRKKGKFKISMLSGYVNMGNAFLFDGQLDSAAYYLHLGSELALKLNYKIEQARTSKHLSELYQKSGNFSKALFYQKQYHNTQLASLILNKDRKNVLLEIQYYTINNVDNYFSIKRQSYLFLVIIIVIAVLVLAGIVLVLIVLGHNRRVVQNRLLDVRQSLLISQLNPQFIFTSLMSVQGKIDKGETDSAVKVLSEFARFVRAIFLGVKQNYVSLASEVDVLSNYISLLQSRFGGELTHYLEVDDLHDPVSVAVPPFLGHAIIESMIVISQDILISNRMLDCRFKYEDDYFVQTYFLNVPFINLPDTAENKHREQQQKAIQLTQQRIKSLARAGIFDITLTIDDCNLNDTQENGCCIEFKFPIVFLKDLHS